MKCVECGKVTQYILFGKSLCKKHLDEINNRMIKNHLDNIKRDEIDNKLMADIINLL